MPGLAWNSLIAPYSFSLLKKCNTRAPSSHRADPLPYICLGELQLRIWKPTEPRFHKHLVTDRYFGFCRWDPNHEVQLGGTKQLYFALTDIFFFLFFLSAVSSGSLSKWGHEMFSHLGFGWEFYRKCKKEKKSKQAYKDFPYHVSHAVLVSFVFLLGQSPPYIGYMPRKWGLPFSLRSTMLWEHSCTSELLLTFS